MIIFFLLLGLTIIAAELLRYAALFGLLKAFAVPQSRFGIAALIGLVTTVTLIVGGVLVSLIPANTLMITIMQTIVWLGTFFAFHYLLKIWYHLPFKKTTVMFALYSLISFLLLMGVLVIARLMMYKTVEVTTAAMSPTYPVGTSLLFNTINSRYELGDVVAFHPSKDQPIRLGRILGVPGDTISIKDNTVFLNSTPLDESSYIPVSIPTPGDLTISLGTDEYFILPDNRANNADQLAGTYYHPIPTNLIWGKMLGKMQ